MTLWMIITHSEAVFLPAAKPFIKLIVRSHHRTMDCDDHTTERWTAMNFAVRTTRQQIGAKLSAQGPHKENKHSPDV